VIAWGMMDSVKGGRESWERNIVVRVMLFDAKREGRREGVEGEVR